MRLDLVRRLGRPVARRIPPLRSAAQNVKDLVTVQRVARENRLRPPTVRELRLLREDAIGRLGRSDYVGELALFTTLAGEVRDGWIPPRFMWDVVEPALNGVLHRRAGMRRTLLGRLFPHTALLDVAYRVRGRWFGPALEPVDLRSHLDGYADTDRFVLKEEGSRQANGTTVLGRAALLMPEALRGPDAVLQRYLTQHEVLSELSPDAVAPVRVLTAYDGTAARSIDFMLRVGVGDEDGIVVSDRAIRLVMDPDGTIHPVGCDPRWRLHRTHPRTGLVFADHRVPHLERAAALCRSLHEAFPQVGLIGWDMGIDEDGRPWVLEANTVHPGIRYTEALRGPAFTAERWELLRHTIR